MPAITTVESALLTPNVLDDTGRTATGAIYDSNGAIVSASVRSVDRTDAHLPADPETIPRHSPVIGRYQHEGHDSYIEEAIYGGHIFAGWGHTITETISTAWANTEIPANIPLVMVPWGRLWVSALPRIRETMALAGWSDRPLIMASSATVFGKVHVPERLIRFGEILDGGHAIPNRMNGVYELMIDRATQAAADPKAPTFLARSQGHRREHPHETAIAQQLSLSGFRVVRGWDMSVQEQIAVINSSSSLVAFSGSSLHNSVFADAGVPVLEILDRRASGGRREQTLQSALCDLRGQPFTRIPGYEGDVARPLPDLVDEIVGLGVPLS